MSGNSWCTVESDPGVFTELISQIGLYDLEQEHLDRIKPVFGLIFLFKYQASPLDETTQTLITQDNPLNDSIYFARQMITNACGTQAILNLILNLDDAKCAEYGIKLGEELRNFKEFTQFLPPDMRGEAISNSDLIRTAHNGFARPEPFIFEEKKPRHDEEAEDAFHFIGYLPINGHLYELDGLKSGPILINNNGGKEVTQENWLEAARVAIQARLQQYAAKEIRFNLMALIGNQSDQLKKKIETLQKEIEKAGGPKAPTSDAAAASTSSSAPMDTSDADSSRLALLQDELNETQKQLTEESLKMERWRVENLRRKHNYVPFIFNLLRLLAEKGKLSGLVESAVKNAAERAARLRQATANSKRKEPPASSTTAPTTTGTNPAATAGGATTTPNTTNPPSSSPPPAKK